MPPGCSSVRENVLIPMGALLRSKRAPFSGGIKVKSAESIEGRKTAVLEEKAQLDAEIADLRLKINNAKAKAREGKYADQQWWARANQTLAEKGKKSQALQLELRRLRLESKTLRARSNNASGASKVAVLYQIAFACHDYMYHSDDEVAERAGDRLEELLEEFEELDPGWLNIARDRARRAS